ncbi:MAG TPA: protein-glutamate O-methyltransferase [bacterium]|nr:protein-glutamate O-methyltransferase [bacterium]HPN43964.1 protein-glutamate O-methyltransferase [bacterium]
MVSEMKMLSNEDFNRLGQFIQNGYGIKMPDNKKTMLQARLQKRLRTLGLDSFHDYCDLVLSSPDYDYEIVNMIDAVTTNKTEFFREPVHFSYLVKTALPAVIKHWKVHSKKMIKIWSAGCSTGEEPYTIAMIVDDFLKNYPDFNFAILATDLSTQVLDKARTAIYPEDRISPVPMEFKHRYLLKSTNRELKQVRIVPQLRSRVTFAQLNFMDDVYPLKDEMDIVFCRNVIIYFEKHIQENIVNKLTAHLRTDGYLFMGHSETLFSLKVPVRQAAPTIYQKN